MKEIIYDINKDCFVDNEGEQYFGKSLPHHIFPCSPEDCPTLESARQSALEELLKIGHKKGADAYEIIASTIREQKPYVAKLTVILYKKSTIR